MKTKKLFSVILTFLLCLKINNKKTVQAATIKACKTYDLFRPNLKVFCETKYELPISCFENTVKKAYIQCDPAYYNEDRIKQQVIECADNGEWSEEPLTCFSKCIDVLAEPIAVLNHTDIAFPTAYVEVIEKPLSDDDDDDVDDNDNDYYYDEPKKPNVYPGLILNEEEVLVSREFSGSGQALIVRVHKSGSATIDYEFDEISYPFTDSHLLPFNQSDIPEYHVLSSRYTNFIKFDEDTRPLCITPNKALHRDSYANRLKGQWESNLCYVSKSNSPGVEARCFHSSPYSPQKDVVALSYSGIDCQTPRAAVITRCQIGYRDAKSEVNDRLSKCTAGEWELYGEPNNCELVCGEINKNTRFAATPLIYNGNATEVLTVPWHVGIYVKQLDNNQTTYKQICGGTIIHSNIVITAGHCFYGYKQEKMQDAKNYVVVAGKTYRSYDRAEQFDQYNEIEEIHMPPNFQVNPVRNDVAIVFLKDEFQFTNHVRPVCIDWQLLQDYNIKVGTRGQIVGWGSTSSEDTQSRELIKTELEVISNAECRRNVNPNDRLEVTQNRFCARNGNSATACRGDSGGGFIIRKKIHGKWRHFLAGVISLGSGKQRKYCADGFMTIFTNIQYYQDVIKGKISEYRDKMSFFNGLEVDLSFLNVTSFFNKFSSLGSKLDDLNRD